MIPVPAHVYVATAPINLHLSFDRLAGIVREQFGADPHEEAAFVFHNARRTHLKILWHDKRGYCVLYKRLDRGTYRIPLAVSDGATHVRVSAKEIALIFEGIPGDVLRDARRLLAAT
ncbi:MAG: IS66 family insertion sequence element accessory protein TnpB [Gammaproteobacteria bacterium]|jgi:transposase|nr:IS66 family insertion sequence element accessory protein TnpB [Gammaproteobacteria bacterium]